MLIKRR